VDASCVITYVLRESLPRCDLAWPYCIGKAFGIAHDRVNHSTRDCAPEEHTKSRHEIDVGIRMA